MAQGLCIDLRLNTYLLVIINIKIYGHFSTHNLWTLEDVMGICPSLLGLGPWPWLAPPSSCTGIYRSFVARRAIRLGPHATSSTVAAKSTNCPMRSVSSVQLCHVLRSFKFCSAFPPGQGSTTTLQKSFEPTGFQNMFSGLYNPIVFSASGANLTDAHLFCLLACNRDLCCDGFVLTQVQGGNVGGEGQDLTRDGEHTGMQKDTQHGAAWGIQCECLHPNRRQ